MIELETNLPEVIIKETSDDTSMNLTRYEQHRARPQFVELEGIVGLKIDTYVVAEHGDSYGRDKLVTSALSEMRAIDYLQKAFPEALVIESDIKIGLGHQLSYHNASLKTARPHSQDYLFSSVSVVPLVWMQTPKTPILVGGIVYASDEDTPAKKVKLDYLPTTEVLKMVVDHQDRYGAFLKKAIKLAKQNGK